ncbi:MAG: phage antirepressor protein, partial [Nanoarchaeota archaeon]|nr:phage antirepressor protein [Nanoarchaeota archaeon]
YKKFKQLKNKNQNFRDHMTDLELILTMVGEKATTDITKERDSQEFVKLKKDAKEGGEIAGNTRKDIEKKLGKSVISKDNYLDKPEKEKRKLLKKK